MNCYCLKNNLVKLHPFESNTFHTSPYLVTQEDSFVVLSMAKKETDGYKRFVESCQTYGQTRGPLYDQIGWSAAKSVVD